MLGEQKWQVIVLSTLGTDSESMARCVNCNRDSELLRGQDCQVNDVDFFGRGAASSRFLGGQEWFEIPYQNP